ncbi:MAG: uroporphyrinogen-III synthase [Phenylobacterium sp.]|uniref:uroporphyrinogen-III synthase n=1 Tax=Phenylobacterium sp. TaxID=1871053 RepID=UPI00391AD452
MPASSKTVWITRASPGAEATAERVRALGHSPLVAPLLAVEMVAGPAPDLAGVGALAFTSANGVRAFAERSADRSPPVFAVGAATAAAARAVGFRRVLSADGDVKALAEGLIARKGEIAGAVLHPGAREPAGDLVGALAAAGMEARRLVLYDTVAAPAPQAALDALPEIDIALIHSPKGAKALAAVLRKHPAPRLRIVAISKAALAPLARARVAAKACSPLPLEAAMLNLLDRDP